MQSRMARFELFIGVWNTTGEVLATEANPAGALVATDTYRWLPDKHFVVHDVDARFDGKPTRLMEVMGYDVAKRRHSREVIRRQVACPKSLLVELSGRRWTISGEIGPLQRKLQCGKEPSVWPLGNEEEQGRLGSVDKPGTRSSKRKAHVGQAARMSQGRKSLPIMPGCSMEPGAVRRDSRDFAVRGSSCALAPSSPLR